MEIKEKEDHYFINGIPFEIQSTWYPAWKEHTYMRTGARSDLHWDQGAPRSIHEKMVRCSVKPEKTPSYKEEHVHMGRNIQVSSKTHMTHIETILVSSESQLKNFLDQIDQIWKSFSWLVIDMEKTSCPLWVEPSSEQAMKQHSSTVSASRVLPWAPAQAALSGE